MFSGVVTAFSVMQVQNKHTCQQPAGDQLHFLEWLDYLNFVWDEHVLCGGSGLQEVLEKLFFYNRVWFIQCFMRSGITELEHLQRWPSWNCCRASYGKCFLSDTVKICLAISIVLWPALRLSAETPWWLEKTRVQHTLSLSYFRELVGAAYHVCSLCLDKNFMGQEVKVEYQPIKSFVKTRVLHNLPV